MLDFQKKQLAFCQYLRNPEESTAPEGVSERRLAVYQELFYNNIEGFIAGGFPVFKSLCSDVQWQRIIREFMSRHRCQTPYFLKICEEFLQFLEQHSKLFAAWPYAYELCHYEWLELVLETSEKPLPHFIKHGDVLNLPVQLSPWFEVGVYHWPVHQIGPDFTPSAASKNPNCLLVYRNWQQEVAFLQSNPATLQLLALLGERLALPDALQHLAPLLGQEVSAIEGFAKQTVAQLHQLGIVLGVAK